MSGVAGSYGFEIDQLYNRVSRPVCRGLCSELSEGCGRSGQRDKDKS